ncbi:major facilitator superfamily domain-containing protein [Dactylonectria macrodidyma]|uniref:Major facilitator superfamily domain-containing protein n=1 Tax=Dactylonectria macrodidyma TaxID=307937 RepID=A0A9P9F4F0_9HYPO|nr:major facilitator superfamily domain-containing protein [Dactylonectria macrodidyma]
MDSTTLPPGTQVIENAGGTQILLAPQPSSDPNQPLNWSPWRKTLHMTLLSLYAMMVFAILCVSVPLWQDFNEELGISYDMLNNGYATNMATLAVGCIIFIPIALRIGRRPVYILTALIMFATAIWQAKMQTVGDNIGTNAVMGIAGAVNEALFQVTVSDLFFVHQRGTMNAIYLIMVMIGNYLGPVAAGYVAISMGWRWVFWLCSIFMGIVCVLMVFFLEETKYIAPPLNGYEIGLADDNPLAKISSITKPALKQPGDDQSDTMANQPRRVIDIDTTIPMKSYRERHAFWTLDSQATERRSMWQQVYQPFQLLVTFPAVMFAALQYGFAIAMLAILAVTQSILYAAPPYSFSTAGVGNMNLPPAIGALLGSIFGGPLVDFTIVQIAKRRGGIYEPETRLWLFLVPGLSMTIGCLMYGLTIAKGMPWIINAVGAGFIGFAIGGTGDMALTYVQDSYQLILGNALTGVVFVRNIIATALVFAVTPWMTNMGVYNMFVLLACIATAVAFTCVPMIVWGRAYRVRLAEKYAHYAALQY